MTDETDSKQAKQTWQEIQERKINMVKERGSRVLKINSPLGSTLFNILRQFDMAYSHFKGRLGEMNGISHEYGQTEQAGSIPLLYSTRDQGVHEDRGR